MSKLTYIHNQTGTHRYTIALILPTSKELIKNVKNFVDIGNVYFPLAYGITKVHPKDQFNKSIGRKEAEKNMLVHTVKIGDIYMMEDFVAVYIELKDKGCLTLYMYKDSKKIRAFKG